MNKKEQKKSLWVIIAIVFFGFVGLSIPYLIFPSLFLNTSISILPASWSIESRSLLLGVTLAAYPFGQFLGSPILGALSDDYGRRKLMSISLMLTAFFSLLTAFALAWQILWLLIASRFFAGTMEGNLSIARAMAADLKHLNKHKTFGFINAAASVSYVVGPVIGGVFSDATIHQSFSFATPFYMMAALFLGLSVLSAYGLRDVRKSILSKSRSFWNRVNFVGRLKVLFKDRRLFFLLSIITMYTIAVDIVYEFGPVYLTAIWMLTPAELSLYNAGLASSLGFASVFVPERAARKLGNKTSVLVSMALFCLALLGIITIDLSFLMLVLFFILGIGIAVAVTNLTVQISDAASDEIQGEVMGVQTSLRVLGDAIICLLGGVFLLFSPKIILFVSVLISITALILYFKKTA